MRRRPGSAPSSSTYGRAGGGAIGVAYARAARCVEQCGRVTNGAADAVLDRQSALVAEWAEGDATLARLESDESATRRRDADRSTGRARRVPRVVGRAPRDGLGGRHTAELGAVRTSGDTSPAAR